jgi:hypothetical protein
MRGWLEGQWWDIDVWIEQTLLVSVLAFAAAAAAAAEEGRVAKEDVGKGSRGHQDNERHQHAHELGRDLQHGWEAGKPVGSGKGVGWGGMAG